MHRQLEAIQKVERAILKEFIRICDKYDLRYYMVEGSLLGAVRHQGMIPWDDDIDVALFRDDYIKFLKVAGDELRHPYELRHFSQTENHIDYIAQLVDVTTCIESPYRREVERKPLWVDIFVIDGFPSGKMGAVLRKGQLLSRKLLLMWSNMDHFVVNRAKRPSYERILIRVGDTLNTSRFLSTEKHLMKMDRAMCSCDSAKTGCTVNFMSEYKWRTVFPADWYGQGRMVPFDGMTVRIPERAEDILSSIYGDYMRLPPEDQRYKHSMTVISLGEER